MSNRLRVWVEPIAIANNLEGSKIQQAWHIVVRTERRQWVLPAIEDTQAKCVRTAAQLCHIVWVERGIKSELYVRELDGSISKDRRTYGEDPPETKG